MVLLEGMAYIMSGENLQAPSRYHDLHSILGNKFCVCKSLESLLIVNIGQVFIVHQMCTVNIYTRAKFTQ